MLVSGHVTMIDTFGYKHWTLEDPPRCFNVGKGLVNRSSSHCSRNHKWHAIVKRYGLRVEVCVGPLEHFDACAWEIENVALMGTYTSNHSHDDSSDIGCNFTRGGEGGPGRVQSDAEKQKHSDDAKAMWADPESRALIVSKLKIAWSDPNVTETRRQMARNTLATPEAKAKHKESLARLDVKEKHSMSAKAYWRDHPEALVKRTESQRKSWEIRKAKKNEKANST